MSNVPPAEKQTSSDEAGRTSAPGATTSNPASRDPFRIHRVVDGDTLSGEIKTEIILLILTVGQVTVDIWLPVVVRLRHVNTPEKNTAEGKRAIEYVQAWVSDAEDLGPIELEHTEQREKYGRLLGVVWASEHKLPRQTLNESLLVDGIAVPYEGGKR